MGAVHKLSHVGSPKPNQKTKDHKTRRKRFYFILVDFYYISHRNLRPIPLQQRKPEL